MAASSALAYQSGDAGAVVAVGRTESIVAVRQASVAYATVAAADRPIGSAQVRLCVAYRNDSLEDCLAVVVVVHLWLRLLTALEGPSVEAD